MASCVLLLLSPDKNVEIEMLWFVDFTSDDSTIKYREKEFYVCGNFSSGITKPGKCFGGVLKIQCSVLLFLATSF